MRKEEKDWEKEVLLDVRDLAVEFNNKGEKVKAVNGISFQLRKGETLGIVGESGSGKSVTSLSIMQLLPEQNSKISKGSITFKDGEQSLELVGASSNTMRNVRGNKISMIFQEPMTSLNPVYTCGNQVMEAIQIHQGKGKNEARKLAIELFKEVQLPRPEKIFASYPHEISGGQKQRVMIAMAMSCDPSILIADEPTTALDVTVQANILRLMEKLREQNDTSIIFITHDLGVIAEIADKVAVMYQGEIVEFGTVWDIFSNPQHPYTKGLLACRPRLDLDLKRLPTVSDFMSVDEQGNLIEKGNKYFSVGEALILNAEKKEETIQKRLDVIQGGALLKVNNLKTYFSIRKGIFGRSGGHVKAVDDVSFEVYPGETLGLVGESGCGKTTLGRSIIRLVEPTDGSIIFDGQDIARFKGKKLRNLRRDIQIIFQDPYSSLNPRITIGDALIEPMVVHNLYKTKKECKEKALELLEKVSLPPEAISRYPHEFSGGQRQRICIARALALNPKFIICDESVSALDVSVQAQVLNLLNELKREFKFTYIFISHDLSVVKFIADRILVMNNGKLVEMGYPDALFERPKEEYTRRLINAIPKGDLEDIHKAQLRRKLAQQQPKN